ncbi:MAG: hypothetical protein V3T31_04370, partial [candidate division Zixibacteria bacterium]
IHAYVRSEVVNMGTWSTDKMAKILDNAVPKHWRRKEFADFEYLKIPVGMGWFLANFLLGVAVTVGVGFWLHFKWETIGHRHSRFSSRRSYLRNL